ncbi:MAG: alpha-xenorhabdolysin family binary toxin subunit A [Betaproteobacteria bacterium]
MPEPSIEPTSGLVTDANPASGQNSQFALFSDSWLEVQSYVGAALTLPITEGDFETKYGSFGGMTKIKDCIAAMKGVREAGAEFGDPKILRAKLKEDPNLLMTPEPPQEVYTHTVWLGNKVHQTAQSIADGYESVLELNSGLPSSEQVTNLKQYLFDEQMGPIPLSKRMSDDCGVLIKKLGAFEEKMNGYNEKLQEFTKAGSTMISDVDSKIGELAEKIKGLERSRDAAYKAWLDFTIAAVSSAVGCFLIGAVLAPFTGGASLVVGAAAGLAVGIGLGVKAAENKAKYNEYCKQIVTEKEDRVKKQRLRADLGDFNTQMQRVGPAMGRFMNSLQKVQGVWVTMNNDMLAIGNTVNESTIGDSAFMVKVKSQKAVKSWKAVDDAAKQFTVESLVDYTSLAFGDTMPDMDGGVPNAA